MPIPPPLDPPWAGGVYSIKRHGVTISNCDSEPVQTPGCIQAHGALLVVRTSDLTVLQASENSREFLGYAPEDLLGRPVGRVLSAAGLERLRSVIATEPVECNPLYLFTLPPSPAGDPLDVSFHTVDGQGVLEFEATGRGENRSESDYYGLVRRSVVRIQSAQTLEEFFGRLAGEVRALTQLDRTMVYRFHEDFHGEVIAESKQERLEPFLGLHYPASDIPQPAREIFTKIGIRPVPDVAGLLIEMVPLANPDTKGPLRMTHCTLRGASVMYTEYLQNMGVAASLTMPIMRDGMLWGLIACHHSTATRFSYQVRAAAEFLAQVASLHLKGVEERGDLLHRLRLDEIHNQLLANMVREAELKSLTAGSPNLLDGMNAGGAAIFHTGRWWRVGATPSEDRLEALGAWLGRRPEFATAGRPIYRTACLSQDFPAAADYAAIGSGLIALPLSVRDQSFLLWFRPETLQTVKWAGRLDQKPLVTGPHGPRLTPRKSFELFAESVSRHSLPWSSAEIAAAQRLRMLIMELAIGRADRLAELNAELARSNRELDAFAHIAGHDLKEPLRGITNYAEMVLKDALTTGEENRDRLGGVMRMAARMTALLDSLLHYSRVGRGQLEREPLDLNSLVDEAVEMVSGRTAVAGGEIMVPRPLPSATGDRVRVREVFVNLLSNAIKYNVRAQRRIEIGYFAPGDPGRPSHPRVPPGTDILFVRDNGIGIEARHFEPVFQIFRRLHGRDDYGGGSGAGLAIVEKLIQQHQGTVWLQSALGSGSTFYFTLAGTVPV